MKLIIYGRIERNEATGQRLESRAETGELARDQA